VRLKITQRSVDLVLQLPVRAGALGECDFYRPLNVFDLVFTPTLKESFEPIFMRVPEKVFGVA